MAPPGVPGTAPKCEEQLLYQNKRSTSNLFCELQLELELVPSALPRWRLDARARTPYEPARDAMVPPRKTMMPVAPIRSSGPERLATTGSRRGPGRAWRADGPGGAAPATKSTIRRG